MRYLMGSFWTLNNKKFKLTVHDDYVYGSLLSSISKESLTELAHCVCNYMSENGYLRLHLAHDSSNWATKIVQEVLVPEVTSLGLRVAVIDRPSPCFQLGWLNRESNLKSLGIFVASDSLLQETIYLHFRDELGRPLVGPALKKILNYPNRVIRLLDSCSTLPNNLMEAIDTSLYVAYLKDRGLLPNVSHEKITVDTMFGTTLALFEGLNTKYNLNFLLANPHTADFRFLNYAARPYGNSLTYHVNRIKDANPGSRVLFGINGPGDCLGVYDLKQGLEISPSGVYLLLLYYLATYRKIRLGKAVISKNLSKRVRVYAAHLGFKPVIAGPDYKELLRHQDAVIIGDEYGGFGFEGPFLEKNAVITLLAITSLCLLEDKSPGEILDKIHHSLKIKCFYHNLYLPQTSSSKTELEEYIEKNLYPTKITINKISEYYFTKNTRLTLTDNVKFKQTEVYVESNNLDALTNIINSILTWLKQ